jgi:hypothetical protein
MDVATDIRALIARSIFLETKEEGYGFIVSNTEVTDEVRHSV